MTASRVFLAVACCLAAASADRFGYYPYYEFPSIYNVPVNDRIYSQLFQSQNNRAYNPYVQSYSSSVGGRPSDSNYLSSQYNPFVPVVYPSFYNPLYSVPGFYNQVYYPAVRDRYNVFSGIPSFPYYPFYPFNSTGFSSFNQFPYYPYYYPGQNSYVQPQVSQLQNNVSPAASSVSGGGERFGNNAFNPAGNQVNQPSVQQVSQPLVQQEVQPQVQQVSQSQTTSTISEFH